MGEIRTEIEKKGVRVKDMGVKVGDILTGQTHMYRTITYWYVVEKVTDKRLTLRRLDVCYPTQYMSNTPGDHCMPVCEWKMPDGDIIYVLPAGYPYWLGHMKANDELVQAKVTRYRDLHYDGSYEEGKEPIFISEWRYYVELVGDDRAPLLSLWYGKPGWVNCD